MKDGTGIEIATVGNEGMVGLPVFWGADRTPLVAFQQIPGESMRMESKVLTQEIKRSGPLTAILDLYTPTLLWCRSPKEMLVIVPIRSRSGVPVGS
jgi:hypothetical protein